jgi:hypothetical protein
MVGGQLHPGPGDEGIQNILVDRLAHVVSLPPKAREPHWRRLAGSATTAAAITSEKLPKKFVKYGTK